MELLTDHALLLTRRHFFGRAAAGIGVAAEIRQRGLTIDAGAVRFSPPGGSRPIVVE